MLEIIKNKIEELYPESIAGTKDVFGVENIELKPESLLGVCEMLKNDEQLAFDYLADITAIDWKDRIEVVYNLTALKPNNKIALRVSLDKDKPEVDSVVSVWKGANYQEREVFDLMGVVFRGHPDLRRILLPEDWEGHPLRKDYVIPD